MIQETTINVQHVITALECFVYTRKSSCTELVLLNDSESFIQVWMQPKIDNEKTVV